MNYEKFTEDYRRWRWVPRSQSDAFRDAHYAASIEIYVARKPWKLVIAEVATWLALVLGGGVIGYGVLRGVL